LRLSQLDSRLDLKNGLASAPPDVDVDGQMLVAVEQACSRLFQRPSAWHDNNNMPLKRSTTTMGERRRRGKFSADSSSPKSDAHGVAA
jgi:hypothetical protein